jgi:hypothetical protein
MKTLFLSFFAAFIAALLTGCASSKPESVPVYQVPPAYQTTPAYRYPPQTVNPTSTVPTEAQPGAATNTGTAAPATQAQPMEVAPSSPGPDYVWMPSYWTIGVGGGWVWVGGHYVLRQGVAGEQLRAARGMLEQARAGLTGKAVKNVDEALDQINRALQLR